MLSMILLAHPFWQDRSKFPSRKETADYTDQMAVAFHPPYLSRRSLARRRICTINGSTFLQDFLKRCPANA
jgi:hypothetical protein